MQNNIVYTPDDVSHALDVLEQYIQTALSEASNNQVDNTVSVQLREITKAIERLEKIKIPVPDCLLKDKSNLLSQLFHSSVSIELVNEIYNRLNMLLERVATILHISNYGNQVKSRKSKLPITKRQIL
ncbi:MAG TPA: hypothetical protein PKJ08_13360, partial [Candidatus Cloacimonadota bacterium]|nr:hypothetical protein [Candidatus Cloacimonadota bacterium]